MSKSRTINEGTFGRITLNKADFDIFYLYLRQKKIVDFLEAIEQDKGIDNNFFIPEVLADVDRIYKYKNSYIDLSDSFENQLTQIENLNQAILQEAVQGKLIKQDPNDDAARENLQKALNELKKQQQQNQPRNQQQKQQQKPKQQKQPPLNKEMMQQKFNELRNQEKQLQQKLELGFFC
jgi:flagellar biosynthesis GTPase FlhF